MTKAEQYYTEQYRKYLREYNAPTMKSIMIQGKYVTPEQAAVHRAGLDLKFYKQRHRKITLCCEGMKDNQTGPTSDGENIGLVPDYKHPDGSPKTVLGGNIIHFCPFCGTRIVVLPYVDKEYKNTDNSF